MDRASIERIVAQQGLISYVQDRNRSHGNGTSKSYVHIQKSRTRRLIYLGAMTKLSKMSEADLASLIAEKTKSAQSAQKGKEEH